MRDQISPVTEIPDIVERLRAGFFCREEAADEIERLRALSQCLDLRVAVIEECAKVAERYPSSGEQTEHPVEYWIRALAQGPDTSTDGNSK